MVIKQLTYVTSILVLLAIILWVSKSFPISC